MKCPHAGREIEGIQGMAGPMAPPESPDRTVRGKFTPYVGPVKGKNAICGQKWGKTDPRRVSRAPGAGRAEDCDDQLGENENSARNRAAAFFRIQRS